MNPNRDMEAVLFCVFLACLTIGLAAWASWMGWI